MTPDQMFSAASALALAGWLALLAAPLFPRTTEIVSAQAIPVLLAVAYGALILVYWSRASGGFDTLENVEALFRTREIVLAGWIHYLAFDLFVGAWEVRIGRAEKIPFLLVVPCLLATFLFGPIGFLAFTALRAARRLIASPKIG